MMRRAVVNAVVVAVLAAGMEVTNPGAATAHKETVCFATGTQSNSVKNPRPQSHPWADMDTGMVARRGVAVIAIEGVLAC